MSLKVQKSNAFFIYTLMLISDLLILLTMNVFFLFKILKNYNFWTKFFESNIVQMYNVSGFNQSKGVLFDKNHDLDDILEIQSGLE